MRPLTFISFLVFHFIPVFGQQLTTCPTTETIVQDASGGSWAVCPQTDYPVYSAGVVAMNNFKDCATYCKNFNGCTKAVFDHVYNYCHAKVDGPNGAWQKNTQFDTIHPYSAPITSCPVNETTLQDTQGRTWAICPNSDYQGTSNSYTRGVNSDADCVKMCAATNGCTKAVWDKVENGCHVKSANGLTWATATRFDSMRLVSSGSAGGFTCNSQQSVWTTTDGSTFAICNRTDWQGASIYALNNYVSAEACAEACSLTPVCTNAVWDRQNNVCHMKAAESGLTQAQNDQFDQIRLIKKAAPVTQAAAIGGKWSNLIPFPVTPAAVYVVPQVPRTSKIMVFSANADQSFGSRTGLTQFATFDYTSGAVSKQTVSNTGHDMFCPGISTLQDGKVLVTGGSDASVVSAYNPISNSWNRAADMKLGRGYQSSATLSNGKIFTIGGSFTGGITTKNGEVYDPSTNTWTLLNGCSADALNTQDSGWRRDNHAWLYGWSDGSVFQAGPSRAMNWYGTTTNGGSTTFAGTRNATDDAMCGPNVMYDTGKILATGGTPQYDDKPGVTTSYLIGITKPGVQATVSKAADLKYPRAYANAVVLPDGSTLVLGGQKRSRQFTDIESFLYPELYSPKTNTWKVVNPAAKPRNYHSAAVLLGDGTVFLGGGGLCYVTNAADDNSWACDPSAQHPDGEIFSPPYLFNADGSAAARPGITALATSNDGNGNWVRAGGSFTVTMGDSGTYSFAVVRTGSATHTVNTDQRRLSLTATRVGGGQGNRWTVKTPSDSGVLLPGYWWLFALNANGTPSVGRAFQVRL